MADILPFPQKPDDRLRAALRLLDQALAEQKRAVVEFRVNLAALGGAVAGLETSMETYRGSLTQTSDGVQAARDAAHRLEATADIWLSQTR